MSLTDPIQTTPAARRLLCRLNAWLRRAGRRIGRRTRCTVLAVARAAAGFWRRWRSDGNGSAAVHVVIADRRRGRALERTLRDGLRRLRRALVPALPCEGAALAVVVQQTLATERPLAGACQIGIAPAGRSYVLIRLALTFEGRRLTDDELLAMLAEGVIFAAGQLTCSEALVLPLVLPATPPAGAAAAADDRFARPGSLVFHAGLAGVAGGAPGAASANGHGAGLQTPGARS